MFKRTKKRKPAVVLTEGMILANDGTDAFALQRENRCYTLLLKGVLVYLIVMGAMGCYLSALGEECSFLALHAVLFVVSLFCALLYYSKLWQNAGYVLLLIGMAVSGAGLRRYINSGFYAVMNDLADEASSYFDSNAMRSYGEQVQNRYLAITISMCYVGCVCCVLMNILISRRMQYILAVPVSVGVLLMPLYYEREPSPLFASMLFGGLFASYMIRGSNHYKLSFQNNCYCFLPKRRQISYVYSAGVLGMLMAGVVCVTFFCLQLFSLCYPQSTHEQIRGSSALKENSKDTMENLSLLGLMGLFNFYPNTGGLTSGVLGGVSAVRFDYEPDLVLEFAPYTEDRIYFKTFTGNVYEPFNNRWDRQTDASGNRIEEQADDTTLALKKRYKKGVSSSAKGTLKLKNVAASIGVYLPYYSENVHKVIQPGETQKYTFYPMVSEETVTLSAEADTAAERDWLDVPKQNRQVLQEFCAQANLTKEDSVRETVQKLEQYYQDQIPYTLRPGATPYQKDFVNYFLQENKRGYCAHFASAATLIFRYLGIPARYVEGYAVDTEDIAQEGTMEYDESYEEYYQGMSLIDSKAVVSVNITDANAHAWVEVFDPDLGWQVADVTPASGEEESDNGFWQRLINFLGGSGTQEDAASSAGGRDTDNGTALSDAGKKAGEGIFLVGAFLLTIFIVKWTVNKGGYFCRYARAGYNDRLVMDYHGYLERVSRREKHLKQNNNYRRQIQWMAQHGYWDSAELGIEEAVSLMEQAGFSDRQLTEQEFFRVRSCFLKHGAISKQKAGEKSGGK